MPGIRPDYLEWAMRTLGVSWYVDAMRDEGFNTERLEAAANRFARSAKPEDWAAVMTALTALNEQDSHFAGVAQELLATSRELLLAPAKAEGN